MHPQEKAIEVLRKLLNDSSQEVFTQVAARRAMLALYKQLPAEVQKIAGIQDSVKSLDAATRGAAQMLRLHLSQKWESHYTTLGFWGKRQAQKQKHEWIAWEQRVLTMRAVAMVHEVLLDTFPQALTRPEIARIFTPEDIAAIKSA